MTSDITDGLVANHHDRRQLGPQKPVSIHQHVGQRQTLTAGNTDGDLPMLEQTAAGPNRSSQLIVRHTDADRELTEDTDPIFGSGTAELLAAVADDSWVPIDMASDWSIVFHLSDIRHADCAERPSSQIS
ncbi:MAG TPA: hypothetical protein VEJ44_00570 [Acidimicrobiales bacterium]|nr:hypothetical protein [Acidimicrobiales bacterium]